MNFRILIPYWGNDARYTTLLKEWFEAYEKSGCKTEVTVVTDQHSYLPFIPGGGMFRFNVSMKTQYVFDHKGTLVCEAIQHFLEPLLVLDSDAIVRKNLVPALQPFETASFAMPADEGALGLFIRNRHGQPTKYLKRCAGVLWFGGGLREELVRDYKFAFQELESGRYFEERRLFEQHAWSIVAHWRNAPVLPRAMNWLDTNTRNGPNPEAFIYHRIGQRKFNIAFAKVRS